MSQEQLIEDRENIFLGVIGTNKTGKTSYLIQIIDAKLQTKHNRILLINPNDERFLDVKSIDLKSREIDIFTGIRKVNLFERNDFKNLLNFRKGLLIMDDVMKYLPTVIPTNIRSLFIDYANYNLDLICVAHGFSALPPAFYIYMKKLVLFRTTDNIEMRKKELGEHFQKIKELSKYVNENFEKHGYNKYHVSLNKKYDFLKGEEIKN